MRNWLSRQAHNLKYVGSNPTPALSLKRYALSPTPFGNPVSFWKTLFQNTVINSKKTSMFNFNFKKTSWFKKRMFFWNWTRMFFWNWTRMFFWNWTRCFFEIEREQVKKKERAKNKIKEKQVWVWSWLRMNASEKLNTCKLNALRGNSRGVANGWVTRKNLPCKPSKNSVWILDNEPLKGSKVKRRCKMSLRRIR